MSQGSDIVCEFFVAGLSIAQPRASRGRGDHVIMAPAKHGIRSWREYVRVEAQRSMDGRPPLFGIALEVVMVFRFKRPKRLMTEKLVATRQPHITKPDWENLVKSVQDACSGVIWQDDCIISDGRVRKRYVMPGEQPGVAVRVRVDDPERWML